MSSGGNVDLSSYLTKTEASNTYATDSEVAEAVEALNGNVQTNYLSKSDASGTYATKTSLNDYLTKTDASNTYASKTSLNDYYNKSDIDTKIANVGSGGSVDLSNYYNKSEIDTIKGNLNEGIEQALTGLSNLNNDLSNYSTTQAINNTLSTYLKTSDASNMYATKTSLGSYLTSSSAQSTYQPKGNYLISSDLSSYATKSYVDSAVANAGSSGGSDLTISSTQGVKVASQTIYGETWTSKGNRTTLYDFIWETTVSNTSTDIMFKCPVLYVPDNGNASIETTMIVLIQGDKLYCSISPTIENSGTWEFYPTSSDIFHGGKELIIRALAENGYFYFNESKLVNGFMQGKMIYTETGNHSYNLTNNGQTISLKAEDASHELYSLIPTIIDFDTRIKQILSLPTINLVLKNVSFDTKDTITKLSNGYDFPLPLVIDTTCQLAINYLLGQGSGSSNSANARHTAYITWNSDNSINVNVYDVSNERLSQEYMTYTYNSSENKITATNKSPFWMYSVNSVSFSKNAYILN